MRWWVASCWWALPSVAGCAGGFLSGFIAQRGLKLPRNHALLSGLVAVSPSDDPLPPLCTGLRPPDSARASHCPPQPRTPSRAFAALTRADLPPSQPRMPQGAGTAYLFSSAALKANLLKHQASQAELKRILDEIEAGPANGGEGGVNGMEAMHDKYASTRGDH